MDITWFQFLLFVHIAFVAIWLGGAAMLQFLSLRALGSDDPVRTANFAADAEWVGLRVFIPASLLVLIAGILMVLDSDFYGFGDDWILIALVLFAVTFAAGAGFFGPESGRIAKLIETEGPTSPAVGARVRRVLALSRADLVLLFLIVYDMVVKPELWSGDFWVAVVVAAVLAALLVRQGLNSSVAGRARTAP
ncbi:MAG TPA: DUF2269 family protein [Gaiellaceae bacterium]|nr:DUF2269 family protein [Gaiellaceae bacterium]